MARSLRQRRAESAQHASPQDGVNTTACFVPAFPIKTNCVSLNVRMTFSLAERTAAPLGYLVHKVWSICWLALSRKGLPIAGDESVSCAWSLLNSILWVTNISEQKVNMFCFAFETLLGEQKQRLMQRESRATISPKPDAMVRKRIKRR